VRWAKKRWKPSRFFRRISGIEKGLVCCPTKPLSFGGANRDRTGDLYNAIVEDYGFPAVPRASIPIELNQFFSYLGVLSLSRLFPDFPEIPSRELPQSYLERWS
jgi:hypothetical protein